MGRAKTKENNKDTPGGTIRILKSAESLEKVPQQKRNVEGRWLSRDHKLRIVFELGCKIYVMLCETTDIC
ncbi:unnamed protein product, partial [Mesorhabditis belari]|uniref:Uncharacterized protein n=1 Tax=Mesorhabditis belari TaxID=2138241 RepID=A0AAF3EEP5_9BILA